MSTHLSLIILRVVVLFSLRALDAVSDRFRVESVTQRWLRETDRSVRRQNQSLVKYNFFQARSKQKSTIFIRSDFFANGPLLGNAIPVFYFAAKPITMPKRDYCSLSHLIVYQFRTAVHRWHSVTRLSTKLFTETWVSASAYTLVWLYALSSWSLTHLPTYSFSISQPITHTHIHSFSLSYHITTHPFSALWSKYETVGCHCLHLSPIMETVTSVDTIGRLIFKFLVALIKIFNYSVVR